MQILDECHHCTKDAPYNLIMHHYKQMSSEDQAKTQVRCQKLSKSADLVSTSLQAGCFCMAWCPYPLMADIRLKTH